MEYNNNTKHLRSIYLNKQKEHFALNGEIINNTLVGSIYTRNGLTFKRTEDNLLNDLNNHINNNGYSHLYYHNGTIPEMNRIENDIVINKNNLNDINIISKYIDNKLFLKPLNINNVIENEIVEYEHLSEELKGDIDKYSNIYSNIINRKNKISSILTELLCEFDLRRNSTYIGNNFYVINENNNSKLKIDKTEHDIFDTDIENNKIYINTNSNTFNKNEIVYIDNNKNKIKDISTILIEDSEYTPKDITNPIKLTEYNEFELIDVVLYKNIIYKCRYVNDNIIIYYSNDDFKFNEITRIKFDNVLDIFFDILDDKLFLNIKFKNPNYLNKFMRVKLLNKYEFSKPESITNIPLYGDKNIDKILQHNDSYIYLSNNKLYFNNDNIRLSNVSNIIDFDVHGENIVTLYKNTNNRINISLNNKKVYSSIINIEKIKCFKDSIIFLNSNNILYSITPNSNGLNIVTISKNIKDFNISKNNITYIKKINETKYNIIHGEIKLDDPIFNYNILYEEDINSDTELNIKPILVNDTINRYNSNIISIYNKNTIFVKGLVYFKNITIKDSILLYEPLSNNNSIINRSNYIFTDKFYPKDNIGRIVLELNESSDFNMLFCEISKSSSCEITNICYSLSSNEEIFDCTLTNNTNDNVNFFIFNKDIIDKLTIIIEFTGGFINKIIGQID